MTRTKIEEIALTLLLKQNLAGEYALSFFDMRRILTSGKAMIGSISDFENQSGIKFSDRPEGLTLIKDGITFVLFDDGIKNEKRINWTIAHELGHIYLGHKTDGKREQSEADRFAAELLLPEAVIRFLDCSRGERVTPEEMQNYFAASLTACKKRRAELDRSDYKDNELGIKLIRRLFAPEPIHSSFDPLCSLSSG